MCVVVAACQPVPKPFLPSAKATQDVTNLPYEDKIGIFVAATDEMPRDLGTATADALTEALHAVGVAASRLSANRASYLLTSTARYPTADGRLRLSWQLIDADGDVVGLFEQDESVAPDHWRRADPQLAGIIARHAAPRVASLMQDLAPSAGTRSAPPMVAVMSVDGAPGDGNRSLTQALRLALNQHGIALAEGLEDDTLVILGTVHMTPRGAHEDVAIHWSLIAPDGEELGSISQENRLAAGTLDGPWGEIAGAIAIAAADGLRDLLDALNQQRVARPNGPAPR